MIPDGYRVSVVYDPDKSMFIARIPELGDIKAMGPTRAEALAGAEEAMEEAFRKAAENKSEMPKPLDGTEFSGEIAVHVSPSLHREIVFLAAQEGVELDTLIAELLSAGRSLRTSAKIRGGGDNRGRDNRTGNNRRRGRGRKYFDIMDNGANFLEYVRSLEGGGGSQGRSGNRRGGRGRGRKS